MPNSSCVLPLRDWSIACLLEWITSTEDRERKIRQLLQTDPALLIWSVATLDGFRAWRELTIANIAERFLSEIESRLYEFVDSNVPCGTEPEAWYRTQIETVAFARAVVQRQNSTSDSLLYVAAILSRATGWLKRLGDDRETVSCLPGWLRQLISEVSAETRPSLPFMAAIHETHNSAPIDQDKLICDAERKIWQTELPVVRCAFLNLLTAKRETALPNGSFDFIEQEKLKALRELAYGASHEINNPLANISTRAQVLLRDEADPSKRRQLATINRQAYRAHEMISDLMLFAKPPRLCLTTIDLRQFVDQFVQSVRNNEELKPAKIRLIGEPDGDLTCDVTQLTTAMHAIVKNAIEASGGECHVALRCRLVDPAFSSETLGAYAEIEIKDDGPGIAEPVRRHLFDPFYSGREAGRGLGFGLSKAWRIVDQHGGQIAVTSDSKGASFLLMIPQRAKVNDGDMTPN